MVHSSWFIAERSNSRARPWTINHQPWTLPKKISHPLNLLLFFPSLINIKYILYEKDRFNAGIPGGIFYYCQCPGSESHGTSGAQHGEKASSPQAPSSLASHKRDQSNSRSKITGRIVQIGNEQYNIVSWWSRSTEAQRPWRSLRFFTVMVLHARRKVCLSGFAHSLLLCVKHYTCLFSYYTYT